MLQALPTRPRPGRTVRLTSEQKQELIIVLLTGIGAASYSGDLRTLCTMARVESSRADGGPICRHPMVASTSELAISELSHKAMRRPSRGNYVSACSRQSSRLPVVRLRGVV